MKIQRSGMPLRLPHARFAAQYCAALAYYIQIVCQSVSSPLSAATLRALSPPSDPTPRPHERERCEACLAAVRACEDFPEVRDPTSAHVGLTLTFMRPPFARALEFARSRGRTGAAIRSGNKQTKITLTARDGDGL